MLKIYSRENIEDVINNSEEGANTKFLKSAHSLWIRFKNYDKQPPYVLHNNNKPVSVVFATFSKRTSYINLYEIVTVQGEEGNGYASSIWNDVMKTAYENNMRRLKLSCTSSSVSWHVRNGLIFWAVDSSGSLRSDQPLFVSKKEQLEFRENAVKMPSIAMPSDSKVLKQLRRESLEYHKFGKIKTQKIVNAIATIQPYWFRDNLFNTPSLMDF